MATGELTSLIIAITASLTPRMVRFMGNIQPSLEAVPRTPRHQLWR